MIKEFTVGEQRCIAVPVHPEAKDFYIGQMDQDKNKWWVFYKRPFLNMFIGGATPIGKNGNVEILGTVMQLIPESILNINEWAIICEEHKLASNHLILKILP